MRPPWVKVLVLLSAVNLALAATLADAAPSIRIKPVADIQEVWAEGDERRARYAKAQGDLSRLSGNESQVMVNFDGNWAPLLYNINESNLPALALRFVASHAPHVSAADTARMADAVVLLVEEDLDRLLAAEGDGFMERHAYAMWLHRNRGTWTGRGGTLEAGTGTYNFAGPLAPRYDVAHAAACQARLVFGKFVSLSAGIQVILCNHVTTSATTYPLHAPDHDYAVDADPLVAPRGDVVVGSDVWVGAGATLLPGVVVGDGAVVGAGAVVSRSVPPYAVVVGNPARVVKYALFVVRRSWHARYSYLPTAPLLCMTPTEPR